MAEQWTCPQCQRINAGDAHFCSQCGAGNPATATQMGGSGGAWLASLQSKRRLLWVAAAGLWLIGCVIVAIGGSTWLLRQSRVSEVEPPAKVEITPAVVTEIPSPTFTSAIIPTPTATLESVTPTPAPTRVLPTATPTNAAEVILFLSSRDYDSQSEEDNKKLQDLQRMELYAMFPDGSHLTHIPIQDVVFTTASWLSKMPDPHHVAVSNCGGGGFLVGYNAAAHIVDIATKQVISRTLFPPNTCVHNWSPDGSKIAYMAAHEKGGFAVAPASNPYDFKYIVPYASGTIKGSPGWSAWSPDGQRIALVRGAGWVSEAEQGLWIIQSDGTRGRKIDTPSSYIDGVAWAPNGAHLAFVMSDPRDNSKVNLWLADGNGDNLQQLTSLSSEQAAADPAWSSDSNHIAFVVVEKNTLRQDIYRVDVDGSNLQRLTSDGYYNHVPVWLPISINEITQPNSSGRASDTLQLSAEDMTTGALREMELIIRGPVQTVPEPCEGNLDCDWRLTLSGPHVELINAGSEEIRTAFQWCSEARTKHSNTCLAYVWVKNTPKHIDMDVVPGDIVEIYGSVSWANIPADPSRFPVYYISVRQNTHYMISRSNAALISATPTPKPIAATPISKPVAASPCPSPGVQITSPAPGSKLTQRYNYIVGTADIQRFHHWRIEYSTNPNGGWVYLLERDYPVRNDKLIMFDASTVPPGPYGLRLTVVDETGNYLEPCVVWYTNMY